MTVLLAGSAALLLCLVLRTPAHTLGGQLGTALRRPQVRRRALHRVLLAENARLRSAVEQLHVTARLAVLTRDPGAVVVMLETLDDVLGVRSTRPPRHQVPDPRGGAQ